MVWISCTQLGRIHAAILQRRETDPNKGKRDRNIKSEIASPDGATGCNILPTAQCQAAAASSCRRQASIFYRANSRRIARVRVSRPSVRPSVRLSVCPTVTLMYPGHMFVLVLMLFYYKKLCCQKLIAAELVICRVTLNCFIVQL